MKLKIGDKVTYVTKDKKEHGIVKSLSDEENYFVVYSCNNDWKNYKKYTAAKTHDNFLIKG
jgi:plastocyanin